MISRYVGGSDESAPLHKLGNEAWAKSRQKKQRRKIRDVAAELLDVYAQREAKKGFAFKYDREEFQQFSATFPFEETYDQEMAINAVISDMCQPKAMDPALFVVMWVLVKLKWQCALRFGCDES